MNETLIFQAIERMREIVKAASTKTKSARRQQAKTDNHLRNSKIQKVKNSMPSASKNNSKNNRHTEEDENLIKPFEDIEVW